MPGEGFYSSKAWKELRVQALQRDRYRCTICNMSVAGYKQSRVDHIHPRKQRPDLGLVLSNLRTLCVSCDNKFDAARNNDKGIRPVMPVGIDGLPESWR